MLTCLKSKIIKKIAIKNLLYLKKINLKNNHFWELTSVTPTSTEVWVVSGFLQNHTRVTMVNPEPDWTWSRGGSLNSAQGRSEVSSTGLSPESVAGRWAFPPQ